MKNVRLIKITIITLISLMVILMAGNVLAATDIDSNTDLNALIGNNASNTSTNKQETNTNTNALNTLNTSALKSNTNNNANNNTNIPYVGAEESIVPIGLMLIIVGISAVYAYKKSQDYKNI